MSEMLDKIRKELHERGGYDTPWETCSQCEDAARAVLNIFRKPTQDMIDAFSSYAMPIGYVEEGFSAMIDIALK
jgi:hypothetical protein